jgi:tetratricopeptide (TPR) repeat protein
MMSRLFRASCLAGFLICALIPLAPAETLLRALPTPDTSKLPPAQAKEVAQTRVEFDKAKATLIGPQLAEAYADMGAMYARTGFKDVAAMAFFDASQIDPKDSRWIYLRGVMARDQKLNADARANFEAAYAIDKAYLPIRYRLADTMVDLGDLDGARTLLESAAHDFPEQAIPHSMLGQIALRQKRYPEAIEQFNAALKIEPAANDLYKYISQAYSAQGNSQAAQDAQGKAGNNTPTIADPIVAGIYRGNNAPQVRGPPLQQAQQLYAQGRLNLAREAVNHVLEADANNAEAFALGARIEATAGNTLIAGTQADAALKLKPSDANILFSRGAVYEFAGDEAHATEFYKRALQADPKLADAYLFLGNSDMRHQRYADAMKNYQQVVVLKPNDTEASSRFAAAEVAAGHCGDALARINAALAKRANDGDLLQIFVRLASTCSAAKSEERDMALDYAQTLYKLRPDATDSSALALALAAHGKYVEAQQYQAEAIYQSVRTGNTGEAAMYKATQATFVAKSVPDRPWPADHAYFKPPLLAPLRPAPKS